MMVTDQARTPGPDWLTPEDGGSDWRKVDEKQAEHWSPVEDQTREAGFAEFPLFPW